MNNKFNDKNINKIYFIILLFAFFLIIPNTSIAASTSTSGILGNKDLHSILSNIRALFPVITSVILAISFVCGIGFIMRGTWLLHTFGQMNMNANRSNGLSGPFVYIIVGAALIYMPSTTKVFSNTIFGTFANDIFAGNTGEDADLIVLTSSDLSNNPNGLFKVNNLVKYDESGGKTLLNYVDVGTGLEWLDLVNTVVMFIQLVGFVAFIRGWFIISHSIGTGAQQGAFSKGLIHLIGGVISINFVPFMETIANLVS